MSDERGAMSEMPFIAHHSAFVVHRFGFKVCRKNQLLQVSTQRRVRGFPGNGSQRKSEGTQMRFAVRGLCVVLAVAVLVSMAQAQEAKKGKGKARKANVANMFKAPPGVTFSEEQKTKVAEIQKQFESRILEARSKAALSKEQQAARKEAVAKAKSDGKKAKEANAAGDAAASLTEEQ
jgi:hypothetical protein